MDALGDAEALEAGVDGVDTGVRVSQDEDSAAGVDDAVGRSCEEMSLAGACRHLDRRGQRCRERCGICSELGGDQLSHRHWAAPASGPLGARAVFGPAFANGEVVASTVAFSA